MVQQIYAFARKRAYLDRIDPFHPASNVLAIIPQIPCIRQRDFCIHSRPAKLLATMLQITLTHEKFSNINLRTGIVDQWSQLHHQPKWFTPVVKPCACIPPTPIASDITQRWTRLWGPCSYSSPPNPITQALSYLSSFHWIPAYLSWML